MLGMPVLDAAIGIVFFFLMFAFVCTTLNEVISNLLQKRPAMLAEAIIQLMGSKPDAQKILAHPLITDLTRCVDGKTSLPSYIPATTFATALLDNLTGPSAIRDEQALKDGLSKLPEDSRAVLLALYQKAQGNWDLFHAEIQGWYNRMMDRTMGWYKRYVQKQTYVLAIIVVLWANFDTLQVGRRLWTDSAVRAAVVEQADARAKARYQNPPTEKADDKDSSALTAEEEKTVGSIVGWPQDIRELKKEMAQGQPNLKVAGWVLTHLLGWSLSILAIALGAPFWFDVLNRFMNLRNAGRAPDEPAGKTAPGGAS